MLVMTLLLDIVDFLIVFMIPLRLLGKGLILPPSIALQDYKNFLVDDSYFLIFYNFLEHLENKVTLVSINSTF